jgi:tetratricopeptide (TPR) repeat protein
LTYLQQQDLSALHQHANGELTYDAFREFALVERSRHIEADLTARRAREAEQCAREAEMQAKLKLAREKAEAARRVRERDPKYIAKVKNQKLRARYGVDTFIEQRCFGRLMKILKSVDAGRRLREDDVVWLSTVAEEYFSEELRAAYHRLEAEFFAGQFAKTRDRWMIVNASGHFRKCGRAREASSLLETINVDQQKSPKLRAALCTTHGGVMRDLRRWKQALQLGERAHAIRPTDYRPCTLLGAIHMETGNYTLGQEWYSKAVERGASIDSIDQDLRSIFFRADPAKQAEMRAFLLREDPVRYAWAKQRRKSPTRRS